MRRTGLAAVAAASVSLLLVACGGSSPSASSSTPTPSPTPSHQALINNVDACKLVTETDASAAVGTPVTNSAASGTSIPGACAYVSADGQATVFLFAQTYPDTTTADAVDPNQMASILNGQFGVSNAKSVTGIGDKAFEYTVTNTTQGSGASPSGGGVAIFVFKSNVVLFIVMTPSTSTSAIEQLARTAVGRLGS